MEFSGSGKLQKTITIDDTTFTANQNISSDLNLDHYDIGIYWNVPFLNLFTAGAIDLEAGINLRIIDFEAKVSDGTRTADASVTIPIPLLYAGAKISPPVFNFVSLVVEGKGIKYDDNYYYDLSAEVRFKPTGLMVLDPFIAIGYRYERLRIDDIDDTFADIKIKQPYIAAGIMF